MRLLCSSHFQLGAKYEVWREERSDKLTRTRALGNTTSSGNLLRSSLPLSLLVADTLLTQLTSPSLRLVLLVAACTFSTSRGPFSRRSTTTR